MSQKLRKNQALRVRVSAALESVRRNGRADQEDLYRAVRAGCDQDAIEDFLRLGIFKVADELVRLDKPANAQTSLGFMKELPTRVKFGTSYVDVDELTAEQAIERGREKQKHGEGSIAEGDKLIALGEFLIDKGASCLREWIEQNGGYGDDEDDE
jgi:hypothetical protein